MTRTFSSDHNRERGQTVILVAISMTALLAMAALAVDVVSLYSARSEAQRSAEAAALAGAKVFADSGFTSGGITQTQMCNGGSGQAERAAQAVLAQNTVANVAPTATIACDFTNPTTPRITVQVARTGLPTFFARIWGSRASSITTTAVAEAFNPSGQTATPVQVTSVMPWLIPNCDPYNSIPTNPNPTNFCNNNSSSGPGPGGPPGYFIDPNNNYSVANPGNVLGRELQLVELRTNQTPKTQSLSRPSIGYFAADVPITATSASCPSTAAISGSCTAVNSSSPGYYETIACENSQPLSCGQTLNIDPNTGNTLPAITQQATLCRIHARQRGCNNGQDWLNDNFGSCTNGNSFPPLQIDGGNNNPNPTLRGTNNITRSDSVVTVPIFDGNNPCPGGACGPVTIIGFMQLGITRVRGGGSRPVVGIITNVVGCGPAPTNNPIAGGPIPVRLVR